MKGTPKDWGVYMFLEDLLRPAMSYFAEEGEGGTALADDDSSEEQEAEGEEEGTAESEGKTEGEETQSEGEQQGEKEQEIPLDAVVTLPSGEKVTIDQLRMGYMREEDYTRKTQELAEARKQLELTQQVAKEESPATAKQEIQEQKEDIKKLLSEYAEDDPQAKALTVILDKLERLEKKVEDAERKETELSQKEEFERQVEYVRKVTDDILGEEQKSYNLPKFKNPKTGKEIDFADRWREVVLVTLSTVDENMTLPEFKKLVRDVGRKAYERLRDEISAITSSVSSAGAKKRPSPQQGAGSGEEGQEVSKPVTLGDKIAAAMERIERAKGAS